MLGDLGLELADRRAPLEPKLKAFWKMLERPDEPEPTPRSTKVARNAAARNTYAHFACVAQPLEEQLFLPLRRLLLARLLLRGYCCGESIARRAALAVLCTSCHWSLFLAS